MATRCPQCGKKPIMGTTRVLLRGHYNPTSKRRRYPNLQWAKVDGKRIKICTDCIKTIVKPTRVRTSRAKTAAQAATA